MASVAWQVSGLFMGNCSCDYMRCPCPTSNYVEKPTKGWCKICIAFHIEKGSFGGVSLDDRSAVTIINVPGAMADGKWALGMILDDRATQEQQQGIIAIMSGQAGGPMTMAGPWVGSFLGVETGKILFEWQGKKLVLKAPGKVDIEAEPSVGANKVDPVFLDNLWHPASTRVALAKGLKNSIHAFGVDFDATEANFSAYAPFSWKSD